MLKLIDYFQIKILKHFHQDIQIQILSFCYLFFNQD